MLMLPVTGVVLLVIVYAVIRVLGDPVLLLIKMVVQNIQVPILHMI